ncbi:MAG: hypothetical protein QM640_15260 [Niabella sp.]
MQTANSPKKKVTLQQVPDVELLVHISFTGNAIAYLSPAPETIDLNEWEWHEEIINGEKYCIVTDRLNAVSAAQHI